MQQDNQDLINAKYCPRVAAAPGTQKKIVYTNFIALSRNGKKNPKIRFCDLELWPVFFKINSVRAVVNIDVRAKFHRAKCNSSWVIMDQKNKKKLGQTHQYIPSLQRGQ